MKFKVAKILFLVFSLSMFLSCSKKDNAGKLYLKLLSVNKTDFENLENVVFSFEFSHPSNETAKNKLLIRRIFVNCTNTFRLDTFDLPEFQATKDYISNFDFSFRNGGGGAGTYTNTCFQNNRFVTDSMIYTFRLMDKNGNKSDSVVSPRITLRK